MNRLTYLLKAQTAYNLHSPFMYRLYTEVLFSHVGHPLPKPKHEAIAWRISHFYGRPAEPCTEGLKVRCDAIEFAIVPKPHRNESRWKSLQSEEWWTASVDLYDVGLLIHNASLHRQHFILR